VASRLWGFETHPSFDWHSDEMEPETALEGNGTTMTISLPKEWARQLKGGTIRKAHTSFNSYVFTAGLESDPDHRVAFKVMRTQDPETSRELVIMQRMRHSGHVVEFLGSQIFPETAYMMMEAVDGSLAAFLQGLPPPGAGACAMPLVDSLPLLIDLLRGIQDLERERIVHGDLTEFNVVLKGGRALIADFGLSAVLDETDDDVGRTSLLGKIMPSLTRHAPETIDGYPSGLSNNVWAVGMIFAKMSLGYLPTEKLIERLEPESLENWREEGRRHVRQLIGWFFSMRDDAGFKALNASHPDTEPVREILMGLLEVSPERRWSASGALQMALKVAQERGIKVQPPRRPPSVPGEWESDWQ